jgi:hypothetical protein
MAKVIESSPDIADAVQKTMRALADVARRRAPHPDTIRTQEIVRCLCLINDTSVCDLAWWYECPLTTPVIGGGGGWDGPSIEHIFRFPPDPTDYDGSAVRSIVEQFLKFPDIERPRLHTPLSRLNTALGEQDNKDKALDLGIAIESVLEVDQPDVSYKVRQRGTLLLGGTSDEKKDTFEHLKELYKLRSKVAHGSTLPPTVPVNGQQIATDQFFKRVLHHMCKDDSKNYRIGIRF